MRFRWSCGKRLIFWLLAACAPGPEEEPGFGDEAALLAARPYDYAEPSSYDASAPTPLVLLLHAYKTSGALSQAYFGFAPLVDRTGFFFAYPDGTENRLGDLYWNATDGCCNLDQASVDDVAYLRAVLHDMKRRFNIDAQRVFVVGHSNGGFMAYRLACDSADEIAGVVSLAGATWKNPDLCKPTSSVAVLQVHGDLDDVVRYEGGGAWPPLTGAYPSARETVQQWATLNGCGAVQGSGTPLDLASDVDGAETAVKRYADCRAPVELWTMQGAGHYPLLSATFARQIFDFLESHPKNF